MALFAATLRAVRPVPAPELLRHVGKVVTCAGMLTTGKPVHTIHDEPMEFVTFDDGAGLIETVLFPEVYRRAAPLLFGPGPYLLRGKVEESYGAVTLTVTALERLDRYATQRGHRARGDRGGSGGDELRGLAGGGPRAADPGGAAGRAGARRPGSRGRERRALRPERPYRRLPGKRRSARHPTGARGAAAQCLP